MSQSSWNGKTRKEYDMDRREERERLGLCIFCGATARRLGQRVLQSCARCGDRDNARKRKKSD